MNDLFGSENQYYEQALSQPAYEPIFYLNDRVFQQSTNKYINWTHLTSNIQYLYRNNQLDYNGPPIQDKASEGMLTVYKTQIGFQEYEQLIDIKFFKRQHITNRIHNVINNQLTIFEELDRFYNLEISLQRGNNYFLHIPDYSQCIQIYGQFSNIRNLKKIMNIIEIQYLPSKINAYVQLQDDIVDTNYKGQFQLINLQNEIPKTINIIYIKYNEKKSYNQQFWDTLKLIKDTLTDGGSFIFEIKNFGESSVTQLLYLLQKIFLIISIDSGDILSISIKIGCYGYQKNDGVNILNKIIQNCPTNIFHIFRTRELTQNSKFEQEVVSFYKFQSQKISQQLKLIKNFTQSMSYNEFLSECEIMKQRAEEKKKKKNEEKGFKDYRNNNKTFNSKPTDNKVINKVEVSEMQFDIPRFQINSLHQQKKKEKSKQIDEKEQEKLKIQKLLEYDTKRRKKTDREQLQEKYNQELDGNRNRNQYLTTAADRQQRQHHSYKQNNDQKDRTHQQHYNKSQNKQHKKNR